MKPFLTTHTLALTPLSPVHIGCGEDFEPTNYIIEDGLLYGFDPSRAVLSDLQRSKLIDVARRGSLAGIQRFFRDNAAAFKPHAHAVMPVAKGVATQYEKRLGEAANFEATGKPVFNQLEIERHVFTGAQQQPFIPGTSFKGALRTAWLDELNGGYPPSDVYFSKTIQVDGRSKRVSISGEQACQKNGEWLNAAGVIQGEAASTVAMERRLMGGDFQTSPLRLLKVADLMPAREPDREVLFAVMRRKRPPIEQDKKKKDPIARKDCVLPGQYRLFKASVTLPALLAHVGATNSEGQPIAPQRNQLTAEGAVDLARLARQSNAYHQQRLRRELAVLDGRGLVNPDWKRDVETLLAPGGELDGKLVAGQAFLVRLGRYGGADNKTLSGEGVASIKIMGAKGEKPTFESTTKTLWLAAQFESDQKHLIPFGWAVVEIDPAADCQSLKTWCSAQTRGRRNMAEVRRALQAEKQAAEQQKAEQATEAARRAAAAEAARQAAEVRADALARMTPQGQAVEELRQRCEDWVAKGFKKGKSDASQAGLYQDGVKLAKQAMDAPDWSKEDKLALADMLEAWLPQVSAPWDAKEQRKKLKLAALRGQ